jgi:hypothetical protein
MSAQQGWSPKVIRRERGEEEEEDLAGVSHTLPLHS